MPTGPTSTYTLDALQPAQRPLEAVSNPVRLPGLVDYPRGQVLGFLTGTAQNEVHRFTFGGTPDAGSTFRVQYGAELSGPIAYHGTAATLAANIQAALLAMGVIGAGNVAVTGTGPFDATFGADLGNRAIPAPTVISSLTGTNPTVAVTRQTKGHSGPGLAAAYDGAASDGTQTAKCLLMRRTRTDLAGRVLDEHPGAANRFAAAAWFRGDFFAADLTGLDDDAVAELGKIVNATARTASGAILRIN